MSELIQNNMQINNFIIDTYLGAGQFGEVWKAVDMQTQQSVAIKFYVSLDQKGRNEFFKEYELANSLNHRNLLRVSQIGEYQYRPYLVMDYCEKGAVSKLVGTLTPNDEEKIWRFICDVSTGLSFLHEHDIVHQDIKPDNILQTDDGVFVIADFGISKNLRSTMRKQSGRNQNAGATAYMGPERFKGDPQIIKASDIWALGVSIYELATGKLPFAGQGGIMQKNGAELPEIISKGYSMELNYVMQKCLQKETWDRFKALDIAGRNKIDFSEFVSPKPKQSTPSPKPIILPKIMMFVGILAILCVAIVYFAVFYRTAEQQMAEKKLSRYYQLVDDCRELACTEGDNKMQNLLNAKIKLKEIKELENKYNSVMPEEYNKYSDFEYLDGILKLESLKNAKRASEQKDRSLMKSYLLMSREFYTTSSIQKAIDMIENNSSESAIRDVIKQGIFELQ